MRLSETDRLGLSCPIGVGRSIPPNVPHSFWEAYQYLPRYFEERVTEWVRNHDFLMDEDSFFLRAWMDSPLNPNKHLFGGDTGFISS